MPSLSSGSKMSDHHSSKPPEKLRVLYIETGLGLAGGQVALLELLGKIDRRLVQVFVCCPDGSEVTRKCQRMGIECHHLPLASSHKRYSTTGLVRKISDTIRGIGAVFYLSNLIRKLEIDIVHANTFKGAVVGGLAARLASRPLIFHDRTTIVHPLLERIVQNLAIRVIASSHAVLPKYPERLRPKVEVISSGVNTDLFSAIKPAHESQTVGFLGRISHEKGLDLLIEAVPAVVDRIPAARFLIAGTAFTDEDEVYLEQVKARVHELGMENRVTFLGYVEQVIDFFSRLSVLALPSRREALSKAMLEAMAAGLAVVAFKIGGHASLISNWETGVLIEPFRISDYASAIVRLLEDTRWTQTIGENARRLVIDRFSTAETARRIVQLYRTIGHIEK